MSKAMQAIMQAIMRQAMKSYQGHLTPGVPKFFHVVPKSEDKRLHNTHAADCWCEPMVLLSLPRKDGERLHVVFHQYERFEVIEEG